MVGAGGGVAGADGCTGSIDDCDEILGIADADGDLGDDLGAPERNKKIREWNDVAWKRYS